MHDPLVVAHGIPSPIPHRKPWKDRGRKTRSWGFYLPAGWVDQVAYDYDTRRPCTEVGRG